MRSYKPYVLPLLAALVVLAYWLLAPRVPDDPPDAPLPGGRDDRTAGGPPEAADTIEGMRRAVGTPPRELSEEYAQRQATVVRGILDDCAASTPWRVTLLAVPGHGGRIVDAVPVLPPAGADEGSDPAHACVQAAFVRLRLPAPPAAGQRTFEVRR
jgi:hypothetical protein